MQTSRRNEGELTATNDSCNGPFAGAEANADWDNVAFHAKLASNQASITQHVTLIASQHFDWFIQQPESTGAVPLILLARLHARRARMGV